MSKLLISACFFTLLLGTASAHAGGVILHNADGNIRYMNQYEAMKACPVGTHLPTIRELAEESQSRGARGILEVIQVNPDIVPAGYYKISAINPNGQKDEFYFNYEGYKDPTGDLGNNWFWSSSVNPYYSHVAFDLFGGYGYVYDNLRYYSDHAVLCIPGQ